MMKKFLIKVIDNNSKEIDGLPSCKGQITIDNFQEAFIMPLDVWSLEEYKKQWEEGLRRLKNHEDTCLVTSIENMASGHPTIEIWVLYKENETVYFQNCLLFDETVEGLPIKLTDFNSKTCYEFVRPRETINEDGYEISEWSIPLSEI
jgi:CdiI N-terminal domain